MIKKINHKHFQKYGWIIDYPRKAKAGKARNLFRIILQERNALGWRIAYLVTRDKTIDRLEQHLNTFESLEPVTNGGLLYISCEKNPKKIECFYLNKPVVLKKAIWHGIVTTRRETEIKITENTKVKCAYWKLGFSLNSKD